MQVYQLNCLLVKFDYESLAEDKEIYCYSMNNCLGLNFVAVYFNVNIIVVKSKIFV